MAEVMAERGTGAEGVSAAEVLARAGVSGETFEELLADREACLLAAFDLAVDRAWEEMGDAYRGESHWLDSVKVALASFLWFLESHPVLGRLLVVYSMGGGELVLRRRLEILSKLSEVVDRGREEGPAGAPPPPRVLADGVVGAVLAVIHNRLMAEEPQPVMELFGSLASIIVLPYLGAGAARRERTRPAPRVRTRSELESGAADFAAQQAGTRLTYRTARVLSAIDDYPGASNREVAERAGIVDQGQVSKLLARLEGRGLIEKAGEARTRGAPNSWRLTDEGETLMRVAGLRAVIRSRNPPAGEPGEI
jgi:DNA-binding MarR family transcriptional regulator/AcrR family transcriptional regulator